MLEVTDDRPFSENNSDVFLECCWFSLSKLPIGILRNYVNMISYQYFIMFHAPMGRFHLELIYYFTYFPPLSHPTDGWDDGGKIFKIINSF